MSASWIGLCAVLTAVAVVGWLPDAQRRLHRLTASRSDPLRPVRWRAWLSPGPAAPALRPRLLVATAVAAVGVAWSWRSDPGPIGWLAGPVLGVALVPLLGRLEPGSAKRRRVRLVHDLPQALDLLAAGLSAGLPLRRAAAAVTEVFDGPVADELRSVLALLDLGTPEPDAWRALRDHPQLGQVAADLGRSVESGTMLVATLHRHASTARAARHASLEVAAKAVGVRSVLPMMLCFIPAFLLVGVVPTVVSALQNALPF